MKTIFGSDNKEILISCLKCDNTHCIDWDNFFGLSYCNICNDVTTHYHNKEVELQLENNYEKGNLLSHPN